MWNSKGCAAHRCPHCIPCSCERVLHGRNAVTHLIRAAPGSAPSLKKILSYRSRFSRTKGVFESRSIECWFPREQRCLRRYVSYFVVAPLHRCLPVGCTTCRLVRRQSESCVTPAYKQGGRELGTPKLRYVPASYGRYLKRTCPVSCMAPFLPRRPNQQLHFAPSFVPVKLRDEVEIGL